MANINKKDALYVVGVVMANGVPDLYGDVLNKTDINKIMTSFVDMMIDEKHSFYKSAGVSVPKNYTTTSPMTIHGKEVPIGSWVSELMVWNEDIKEKISTGEYNGLSLGSVPTDLEVQSLFMGTDEAPNYRDIQDKDNIQPLAISFVNGPGNGFLFDYYVYDQYILREKPSEDKSMTENSNDNAMADFAREMFKYITREAPQKAEENVDEKLNERFEEYNKKFDELEEKIEGKFDSQFKELKELLERKDDGGDGGDDPVDEPKTSPTTDVVEDGKLDTGVTNPTPTDTTVDSTPTPTPTANVGATGANPTPTQNPIIRSAPQTGGINYEDNKTNPVVEDTYVPVTRRNEFGEPI